MRRSRSGWLLLAALGMPGVLRAQDPTRVLDSIFDAVDRGGPLPAVAMAVVWQGRVVYQRTAGFADLERGVRADADTRFDWASVAKQFTGFAVARLVEAGAIRPDADVRDHLPELDLSGASITVEQLLHHTAGLEDSDGLLALAGWRAGDEVHDRDVVDVLVRQRHLRWVPGEQEGYGNGGYALLAEIVARVSGMPFPAYVDSAVFRPLGMTSSSFPASSRVLVPHRALPYVRRPGGGFDLGRVDTYVGAGGLVAPVGDLALWTRHLLHPVVDPDATRRIQEPGRLATGEPLEYGWGIGVGTYRGRTRLAHGGSGVSTETYVAVFPEDDFAVVAASAAPGIVNPALVAMRAADGFLADRLEPVQPPPPGPRMVLLTDSMISTPPEEAEGIVVPAEALAARAGAYRFDDGSVLVVRAAGGRLEFGYGGPPFLPLFPVPGGEFVSMPFRDRYAFESEPGEGVVRLVVGRARSGSESRRVGERVSVPRFDATTAAPYLGWYHSDELGAVYEVALGEEGLVLRHARHGTMPLIPTGMGDEFGVDGALVRGVSFSRPGGGSATGMELRALSWDARSTFRRIAGPGGSSR